MSGHWEEITLLIVEMVRERYGSAMLPVRDWNGKGPTICLYWSEDLSIQNNIVRSVRRRRRRNFDLRSIPLNDPKTYRMLASNPSSIPFFDTESIRDLITRSQPTRFKHLIAIVNLCYRHKRDLADHYLQAKLGREHDGPSRPPRPSHSPHPAVTETLSETFGVLIYKEQIMRILHRLGGITPPNTHQCLLDICKQKQHPIDTYRSQFIEGSQKQGLSTDQAAKTFQLIQDHAEDAVWKSSAAANALVGYRTAYLKANFPVEFRNRHHSQFPH